MPRVIASVSRKGGVGKTTLVANLAAELLAMGRSVTVYDMDPNRSLSKWAGLGEGLLPKILQTVTTTDPAAVGKQIQAEPFDFVLLDTPPNAADPALVASLVADLVLIPVGPSALDVMEAKETLDIVQEARGHRGGKLPRAAFVPCKTIARAGLSRDLPALVETFGAKVLTPLRLRTVVAETVTAGLTLAEYAPRSEAREEFTQLAREVLEIRK